MTGNDDFHVQYVAALRAYLNARDEDSLAVGHELGRRALQDRISMLEIVEHHVRLILELSNDVRVDAPIALEFLLQTLAPLDVATRGFLDGTKRFAKERARAEGLADRDKFRTALVNSLQEGFFVADHEGSVVEMNHAFIDILGYPSEGLPYRWPHPWLVDRKTARDQQSLVRSRGGAEYETPVRHRDGHLAWVKVSINAVRETDHDRDVYVGTIRDITAERAFAARESAVLRLATAVAVAKERGRAAVDHPRRVPRGD
jgi:PAS domain S-box-containing protein